MSHWIALLPPPPGDTAATDDAASSPCPEAEPGGAAASATPQTPDGPAALDAEHLAWWALQFTPRVAVLEGAVVMEVQASERLFGGWPALWARISTQAQAWQVSAMAPGHTALAALARARAAASCPPDAHQAASNLNELPLSTLSAMARHEATLSRLGCRTLGQVMQLPRGGLSRRFGAELLRALDQAEGTVPLPLSWVSLPPRFDERLELPGRVDVVPALHFAVQRLLLQLCAWLAGMHAGVLAFTLGWWYDGRRHDGARTGQHTIRLGSPSRDLDRLSRLLKEHLQRIPLAAPVTELRLTADEVQRLAPDSAQLFQTPGMVGPQGLSVQPDALLTPAAQRAQRDALQGLIDKLSVRLGPERVRQGRVVADHRVEQAQAWRPAVAPDTRPILAGGTGAPTTAPGHLIADLPHPCWVLSAPQSLHVAQEAGGLRERPLYQGPLQLLAGPHRVEAGWWDDTPGHSAVARDYYLASSPQAGLLWVFKTRTALQGHQAELADLAGGQTQASPWFLHGVFA